MSENDIFDKIDSKADETQKKNDGEEKKITLESILREYDAKKAEAERKALETESAEKRFVDFKKELENYNTDETQDDTSADCDDSDMTIASVVSGASEDSPEISADISAQTDDGEPDIDEKKLDIMSQISKRFENTSESSEKNIEDFGKEPETVAEIPGSTTEFIAVGDTESEDKSSRLSDRIDDEALKNAFMDDGYDVSAGRSRKKKNKKKNADSFGDSAEFTPYNFGSEPAAESSGKNKYYDENGERVAKENPMFAPVIEYTRNSDPAEAFGFVRSKLLGACLSMIAVFAIMLICFYTEAAPVLNLPHARLFEPGKTGIVYVLFDLQLLLFAVIIKLNSICRGATGLFCKIPCSESAAFAVVCAASVHAVVSAAFASNAQSIPLMCSTACFSVFLLSVSDFLRARNEFMAFRVISSENEKYAFKDIAAAGEETPDEISKFVPEGSTILDIRKISFTSDFFKRNAQASPADSNNNVLIAVSFGVALVASVLFYIFNRGIYEAFCGFVCVFLCALQSGMMISVTLPESVYSDKAAARKCAYVGHELCDEFEDVSVVSFKDVEVFPPKDIKVTNIRTYGDTRIDNVIVTMARIFSNVGGPLSSVFSNSVTGITTQNGEMKIIDVAPDGLWVKLDGYNTYIGTLSYMIENNFEIAPDNGPEVLRQSNCGILYLASSDRVIAKFYIEYKLNPTFESILRNLYTQNICARIKTLDPCINNDFIRASLRRPECLFSVVKPGSPEDIEKTEEAVPASIVCSSNENSLIHSFLLIRKMRNAIRANNAVKVFATVAGLALSALMLVGGSMIMSPALILVVHMFWTVTMVICTKLSEK